MNQELGFETIPFEIAPEFQGELFEEEGELGGRRSFAGGGSRYSRPRSGSGLRSRGATRRPFPRPRPRPRGPWAVVREPYGFVSEPYPGQPEPSGSERVRWVQDCLNQTMGLQLPVTGVMGPETRSAVRSFQKQQRLRESGIVGPDTEEALKAACGGPSEGMGVNGEILEEQKLGPLTATLEWKEDPSNPGNPKLFSRTEALREKGAGIYIAVDTNRGNEILKVGKTSSFAERPGGHQDYRDMEKRRPGLRFYFANIKKGAAVHGYAGGVDAMIERAILRLMYRAGIRMREHGQPFTVSRVEGKVSIRNVLPKPLMHLLKRAYEGRGTLGTGVDWKKQRIPKRTTGTRMPTSPSSLLLDPVKYPEWEWPSPFSEAEEIELAAELLSVSNEEELDQFLGKLVKGAWKGIKKVGSVVGKIAKPLGGVLKGVAKAALPFVGGALGSFIPIPGVGTALGSALGGALSQALEIEFGELNQEEQEFEMARRFVRTAGTAAQLAAQADPYADLEQEVQTAVMNAARQHVPNLPNIVGMGRASHGMPGQQATGQWVRRGNRIVVMGA